MAGSVSSGMASFTPVPRAEGLTSREARAWSVQASISAWESCALIVACEGWPGGGTAL